MRRDSCRSVPRTKSPPSLDDLLVLGVGLRLELLIDRRVLGLVLRPLLFVHVEHQVAVVVPLPRRHLLPRKVFGVAAEEDVDASAGHVRRDGDGAEAACLRDDHRFLLVVLRVQDVVLDAPAVEVTGEPLGLLDRDRTHQGRLPAFVSLDEVVDNRVPFRVLALVDEILLVGADHLHVRRDLDDAELVRLLEFGQLRPGRTGHARELVVHLEVVLDGDRRERLVLLLDPNAFLGLDRLVQALRVAPAFQHSARELIDDLHLAVRDEVLDVAVVELLGSQGILEVVHERRVDVFVEVLDAERLLHPRHAGLGHGDSLLGLVDLVVLLGPQPRNQPRERLIPLGRVGHHPADDERRARLVDQDGVHLVDDGVRVPPLDHVVQLHRHVVAKVVESEFVVRAVGDVRTVSRFAFGRHHLGLDQPDRRAERPEDGSHPLRVALGQVVVDRDDMHACAGQRVEVRRHGRGERLALTGLHLGDVAVVQRGRAHHLHVEVPLPDRPPCGLTDAGECLRLQVVEILTGCHALLEPDGLRPELIVGEVLDLGLVGVNERDDLFVASSPAAAAAGGQELVEAHRSPSVRSGVGPSILAEGSPKARPSAPRYVR